jgi:7,8-dihydroneopterin aldolase/epimerase/oxygenase
LIAKEVLSRLAADLFLLAEETTETGRRGSQLLFRLAAPQLSATLGCVNDQIHIEQLEVFAQIGVPDEERSQPQRLTISITFWPTRQGAELGDEIGQAVDYAEVCAETKKFVQDSSDRLIETLADALTSHLLQAFEIQRITIELRKFILPDVQYVAVTVTRDRAAK